MDTLPLTPEAPSRWLVYADWLEEQSDQRAEFIREWVKLVRFSIPSPEFRTLHNRLAKLADVIDDDWLKRIGFHRSPVVVSAADFPRTLASNFRVFVLHFWAAWNAHDRDVRDITVLLSESLAGWAHFGTVNVDDELELCQQHAVRNVPWLCYYHRGRVVNRHAGSPTANQIRQTIRATATGDHAKQHCHDCIRGLSCSLADEP